MRLDPISLRLFIAVLEEGTISAAAEREHIAAAAVSKRLSDLENILGTKLVTRTNRGISPTTAGTTLQSMARHVLRELDEIAAQLHEYADGERGLVRVYANISVITQFLPHDIMAFTNRYPNVQVQLEEKISPIVIKSVEDNAADIGIFSSMPGARNIVVLPYREDNLCLIVPKGHPLTVRKNFKFADALNYEFIGLHSGSAINNIIFGVASGLDKRLKIKVQVTAFDALCFMVDSGLGIGVIPLRLAEKYARIFNIDIIKINAPWAFRKLNIGVRNLDGLSSAARLFIDYLSKSSIEKDDINTFD